ncbi:MAG: NAD(P)/FAD-dependent oxidoreductase [Pyrinomonadaceae bacterium]
MAQSQIIIIGAGLAGSLLAIYLAKRGIAVEVFEARDDLRRAGAAAGRSINLALSDRGIAALREVGMDEYMLAEAVPMYGRMIHSLSAETKLLPYSGRQGEYINSVSRAGLNVALINEAEKYAGVNFIFNERCVDFDTASGEVSFASGRTIRGDTVIATDGAGSMVRQSMERTLQNFESSSIFLEHGYKEIHIPSAEDGGFLLEQKALHIWPRHQFMMIALPNADGSFTCTMFLALNGPNSFEEVSRGFTQAKLDRGSEPNNQRESAAKSVLEFFHREFPDAVSLMPTLVEDFFHNPTGQLGTVKCWPWNIGGKALLLGDSAHAVVPFYGQGMNCAFEDVRVLDSLINMHGDNWEQIYDEYGQQRKINTDAIAEMAEENFYEMRDATADPVFQRKRELETKLEQTYPNYFSKYSMVTFREDLPYSVAKKKGNAQDHLLMEICSGIDTVSEVDLASVMEKFAS